MVYEDGKIEPLLDVPIIRGIPLSDIEEVK